MTFSHQFFCSFSGMYAIVEFRLTQEVEIVPCTWVTGNNCLWPKVSTDKAVKLVRKGGPPGPGFSEFEVTVKGLFSEYIASLHACSSVH